MEYLSFWALYFITGTSHQLMYSWNRTQVVLRISLVSFASHDIIGSIMEALLTGALVRDAQEPFSPWNVFRCKWNYVWNVAVLSCCLDFLSSQPHHHHKEILQQNKYVGMWKSKYGHAPTSPVPLGHLSLFFSISSRCLFLKILSNLLFTLVDLCSHNILPSRCKVSVKCLHGRHGVKLGFFNPFFCLLILSCK